MNQIITAPEEQLRMIAKGAEKIVNEENCWRN